jgi:hypothetical protein
MVQFNSDIIKYDVYVLIPFRIGVNMRFGRETEARVHFKLSIFELQLESNGFVHVLTLTVCRSSIRVFKFVELGTPFHSSNGVSFQV